MTVKTVLSTPNCTLDISLHADCQVVRSGTELDLSGPARPGHGAARPARLQVRELLVEGGLEMTASEAEELGRINTVIEAGHDV